MMVTLTIIYFAQVSNWVNIVYKCLSLDWDIQDYNL